LKLVNVTMSVMYKFWNLPSLPYGSAGDAKISDIKLEYFNNYSMLLSYIDMDIGTTNNNLYIYIYIYIYIYKYIYIYNFFYNCIQIMEL